MPTPEANENLFTQFLDDYFAECDEHLTVIRESILALESYLNQPQVEKSLLDKLFGSFHSLKGLSGMVGFKEAEQIAHEMESYLRSLRQAQVILTQPGIDALVAGIKILEQVINNYRIQAPIPDILPTIEQLQVAFSTDSPPEKAKSENLSPPNSQLPVSNLPSLNIKPEEKARIIAAIESGARPWQCQFIPAPEKANKGINVNTIRQRLQSIGELVHASPRVIENGGIVFDFILISNADATTFNDWEKDGLTITPYLLEKPEEPKATEAQTSKEPPASEGEFVTSNEPKISKITPTLSPIANSLSTPSNVVRVDLLRLDELMRIVGELVITRARLEDNLKTLNNTIPASRLRILRENTLTLERQLRDLREGVMRVRLVPIGEIFARMQFVIRDLAKETQKQIVLELSGQNTEIDKFIVERMIDPLLHLVRNAVSHGLESEAERVAKGKPKEGKIFLRAFTAGEMVVIEVEDDGRGVDVERVMKLARQQGNKEASRLANVSDTPFDATTVLDIICSSGFSTKEQADKISGRGVGMAVVKNAVQELGGFLTLNTTLGKGTKFTIQLPLTLSIADALVVSVCHQTFVIPLCSVREVIQVKASEITYLENNEIIRYRNNVFPLIRLRKIFNLQPQNERGERRIEEENLSQNRHPPKGGVSRIRLVVVGNGLTAAAIPVDRILGQQEIVVRPLTDPLVQVVGIAGATELGNGKVVLIIDPIALTRMVMKNY